MHTNELEITFSVAEEKGGRGAAVKRGVVHVLENYPELNFILEADSDGSHRPIDIQSLLDYDATAPFVIGSRYLPTSKIIGWPLSRKLFSKILNQTIPRLMGLHTTDITNGLRRYSADAARIFAHYPLRNSGFIYLTEQALILHAAGFESDEIPTTFINRTVGNSTVTYREVFGSLKGITMLLVRKPRLG
jgi:dolichol-phosphate mannosyltransferase